MHMSRCLCAYRFKFDRVSSFQHLPWHFVLCGSVPLDVEVVEAGHPSSVQHRCSHVDAVVLFQRGRMHPLTVSPFQLLSGKELAAWGNVVKCLKLSTHDLLVVSHKATFDVEDSVVALSHLGS